MFNSSWVSRISKIKMPSYLWFDVPAIGVGVLLAVALFWFGMQYPLDSRITGDAAEYLQIASQFKDLSSALSYIGERSTGMPLFDWIFSSAKTRSQQDFNDWTFSICLALLIIHLVSSWILVQTIYSKKLIHTKWGLRFLFVFIASFPALIGHTTTPLTDTLAVDLSIILFGAMIWSQALKGGGLFIVSILIGAIGAYSCLVRPAYAPAMIIAISIFVLFALLRNSKERASFLTLVVFSSCLGFVSIECKNIYGKMGLQNPNTFDSLKSLQVGLRGSRLLWGEPEDVAGEPYVIPDPILKPQFYDRCHIKKIVGTNSDSLLGCLFEKPQLVPVYIVKKWIGLFDHFRFQAYLEGDTPTWLRVLSRSYDAIAWIGFWFALLFGFYRIIINRKFQNFDIPFLAYFCFVLFMLAEHTVLHPEDRYGLVLIPLSGTAFVIFIEYLSNLAKAKDWRNVFQFMSVAAVFLLVFILQILQWDHITR